MLKIVLESESVVRGNRAIRDDGTAIKTRLCKVFIDFRELL